MKNAVIGYVGTISGALVALLALASVGDSQPNYLVSAVLVAFALALCGVGWYGLQKDEHAELGSSIAVERDEEQREAA